MTDVVTDMAIEGTHAHASRQALGVVRPDSQVWDHWLIRGTPISNTAHVTVRPGGASGPILRVFRVTWDRADRPQLDTTRPAAFVMSYGRDVSVATARELTRHLVRNVANGNLPVFPWPGDDQRAWWAAYGVAAAYIERFGVYDTALPESTRYGHPVVGG